jgi:hypothetical protein
MTSWNIRQRADSRYSAIPWQHLVAMLEQLPVWWEQVWMLHRIFPGWIISCFPWATHSTDYFLWGTLQSCVYDIQPLKKCVIRNLQQFLEKCCTHHGKFYEIIIGTQWNGRTSDTFCFMKMKQIEVNLPNLWKINKCMSSCRVPFNM